MVVVKGNRAALAGILATVRQTATAGIRDLISGGRALIAGDVDHLDHILLVRTASHGDFNTLGKDCSFFIYTAPHGGRFAGNDDLGNVQNIFQQSVIPCLSCHLTQYLIL